MTLSKFEDRFKPNLNYPKKRKSAAGRRVCAWMSFPLGRGVKCSIGIIGDKIAGRTLEMERSFLNFGVGTEALASAVRAKLPWIDKLYALKTDGDILTSKNIFDRYHKQYYRNDAPRHLRGLRSKEHYFEHELLRPIGPAVEKLIRLKGIITVQELDAVCYPNQLTLDI